ncbi:MAG: D-glycero-beta-D-manno-heptose 1-phosphate adenylyltransferase [Planctomycetes bacterium]|nr:D-glycero-beta-D-manno-heptose 1-phosphate adenylyltransferase [Planctomycetota bacterium]
MRDLMGFVESLGRPRITLLGDFMLDRYIYGDCRRISQEAPVPVLRVVRQESNCGGAASVAVDIIALGADVSCIGTVGADEAGEDLVSRLIAAGAKTAAILKVPNRPTTTKTRLIGLAQQRHQQQIMRVDEEDASPLEDTVLASIRSAVRSELRRCSVLAIEDCNKAVLTDVTAPQIIADARAAGATVLVDPAAIADYGRYRGASLLTPNRQEAELATGVLISDDDSCRRAAERILYATQAQAVVITLDKQGAFLQCAGQPGKRLTTRERQVYDVTGAGDVVLAMLAVAAAGGADWETAVALANVAGGLEVERFGVVPITRHEVLDELAMQKRQQHGKVVDVKTLMAEVRRLHAAGKTIVWTNGCFDILHAGHVEYLNFARRQGDALIVGVNSDRSVRLNKGPNRPIVGEQDRAEVLAALGCVDYVVIFDDETPIRMIEKIAPNVLVKGADWAGAVVGQDIVEAAGGTVVLAELRPERSTTNIINKVANVYGNAPNCQPEKPE